MTKLRTNSYDYIPVQGIDFHWYNRNIFCRFTDCVHLHNQ